MKRSNAATRAIVVALMTAGSAATLRAQQEDRQVEVHAFGGWAFGRTGGNVYLSGGRPGRYDDAALALNVNATVSSRLRIVGQVDWQDDADATDIDLDYSFAEWTLSSRLRLRAGKIKQPFGISAEVFDVGTLRPFAELPQAVYGPSGLVGESYKGLGLTGNHPLGEAWNLNFDVYFGGQTLREYLPPENAARGEPFEGSKEQERTRDMLGGRLVLDTPVSGLSIGASGYAGKEIGSARRVGVGAQAEFLAGPWLVRGEWVHESVSGDLKASGMYVEAARRLARWQVAAQYGRFTSSVLGVPPPAAPSLLGHEELALGLNYWWAPGLVFKLSGHRVDGNRFAGPEPEAVAAEATAGRLEARTNLILFAVQFSF